MGLLKKKRKEIELRNGFIISKEKMLHKALSSAAKSYKEEYLPMNEEDLIKDYLESPSYAFESHFNKDQTELPWPLLAFDEKLFKTAPSDMITVSSPEMHKSLIDIWDRSPQSRFMPSDLFHAGTIPLLDIIIHEKYFNNMAEDSIFRNDINVKARIKIFPDYKQRMEQNPRAAVVGVIMYYTNLYSDIIKKDFMLYSALIVDNKHDDVFLYGLGTDKSVESEAVMMFYLERLKDHLAMFLTNCKVLTMCWYGIQLSLLNPKLRVLVKKAKDQAKTAPVNMYSRSNGRKSRKVKYVRNIILDESFVHTVKSSHIFRQRIWWVIGHWRQYSNGKRIFINGYWKGVDRKKKEKEVETREREVV